MIPALLGQVDYNQTSSGGGAGILIVLLLIYLALIVLLIVASWIIFKKAGKPGWAAIVPIYNTVVICEIVGRPLWWVLLLLIPLANIVFLIILLIDLAKSFGKGSGFAVGLILLPWIFFPVLAFGSSRYVGPAAAASGYGGPPQGGYGGPGGYPPQQYPPQQYPPQQYPPQQYPPPRT